MISCEIEPLSHTVAQLMQARRTILPKRLCEPGPDAAQRTLILEAAATAPDHGQLCPWRFVLVPTAARARLADVFAQALCERDAAASTEQVAQARDKAFRSPLLLLVIVDAQANSAGIDLHERLIATGCAVQNMLLMATAMGFGSALTSGQALKTQNLRALFGVTATELALCFVSIGTVQSCKPGRLRPALSAYVSSLGVAGL